MQVKKLLLALMASNAYAFNDTETTTTTMASSATTTAMAMASSNDTTTAAAMMATTTTAAAMMATTTTAAAGGGMTATTTAAAGGGMTATTTSMAAAGNATTTSAAPAPKGVVRGNVDVVAPFLANATDTELIASGFCTDIATAIKGKSEAGSAESVKVTQCTFGSTRRLSNGRRLSSRTVTVAYELVYATVAAANTVAGTTGLKAAVEAAAKTSAEATTYNTLASGALTVTTTATTPAMAQVDTLTMGSWMRQVYTDSACMTAKTGLATDDVTGTIGGACSETSHTTPWKGATQCNTELTVTEGSSATACASGSSVSYAVNTCGSDGSGNYHKFTCAASPSTSSAMTAGLGFLAASFGFMMI